MESGFGIWPTIEDLFPENGETTPEGRVKNVKQPFSTVSWEVITRAVFEYWDAGHDRVGAIGGEPYGKKSSLLGSENDHKMWDSV